MSPEGARPERRLLRNPKYRIVKMPGDLGPTHLLVHEATNHVFRRFHDRKMAEAWLHLHPKE